MKYNYNFLFFSVTGNSASSVSCLFLSLKIHGKYVFPQMLSSPSILQLLYDDPLQRFKFWGISEDNKINHCQFYVTTKLKLIKYNTNTLIFVCVAMLKTFRPHIHMWTLERCHLLVKKIAVIGVSLYHAFPAIQKDEYYHSLLGTKVPTLLTSLNL